MLQYADMGGCCTICGCQAGNNSLQYSLKSSAVSVYFGIRFFHIYIHTSTHRIAFKCLPTFTNVCYGEVWVFDLYLPHKDKFWCVCVCVHGGKYIFW